jgi:hypothetical protein
MASDKPFGLRDIQIALQSTPGTAYDLPVAARMSLKDTPLGAVELRGDDALAAVHVAEDKVVIELEEGGIDLKVWSLLSGGTFSTGSGYYRLVKAATNVRPYLILGAKVIDNAAVGDVHVYVFKCRCTDGPSGEFRDGQFFLTAATLEGIDDVTNGMYCIRENDATAEVNLTTFV